MKNLFKTLGLVAVAATTLVGCVKTVEQEPALTSHKVTIKVDQLATKTAIVEGEEVNTFVWSAEDVDRFKVWENGVEASSINMVTEDNYQTIALECEFPGGAESPFTYDATMAANWEEDEPYIPAVQDGSKDVYDPNADILVAKTVTVDESTDNLVMRFRRPVVVNKMTLSGLEAGETITSVSVATQGGEYLTGSFNTSTEEWTGMNDVILINTNEEVDDNGEISVFFVTMPASVALTINAVSEQNSYTKAFAEGSLISFEENMVTRFEVAMNKNEKQDVTLSFDTATLEYTTTNYEDCEGQAVNSSVAGLEITYSIDGDEIGSVNEYGEVELNGAAGTATITASFPGDSYYNEATATYDIVVSKSSCSINPFEAATLTAYTANGSEDADLVAFEDWEDFASQMTDSPEGVAITYSFDGDIISEIDVETGAVTLTGEPGTATVYASFDGDDVYDPADPQSYTIVVKELKKASYTVTGNISSKPQSFTDTENNAWAISATGTWSGHNSGYVSVASSGYGSGSATSLSFTTSAYSDIKRVCLTGSGTSSNSANLQATLSIGGTQLGEAENMNSHTSTTSFYDVVRNNDDDLTGEVSLSFTRATARNKSINFKSFFVVYAEDPTE